MTQRYSNIIQRQTLTGIVCTGYIQYHNMVERTGPVLQSTQSAGTTLIIDLDVYEHTCTMQL